MIRTEKKISKFFELFINERLFKISLDSSNGAINKALGNYMCD
jgi:hypothetical protein